MEEWKILVYNNVVYENYSCSNKGNIKNNTTEIILKQCINYQGRYHIVIRPFKGELAGKSVTIKIHRAVACTFIPNPENKPEVNHKNGDKTKNEVDNLEWNTFQENRDHAIESGLYDTDKAISYIKTLQKKTTGTMKNGKIISFDSMMDAAKWLVENNISKTKNVSSVRTALGNSIKRNQKTYLGIQWIIEESIKNKE